MQRIETGVDADKDPRGIAIVGLIHRARGRSFGGAPIVIRNLANFFVGQGISVDLVVFTRAGITELPVEFDPRVRVHRVCGQSRALVFLQLLRVLIKVGPAALMAVGTKGNMLCAWAQWVPGLKIDLWATVHHALSAEMKGWSAAKQRRRIRLWHRIARHAKGVIGVSQGVVADLRGILPDRAQKLRVIYNPIVHPGLDRQVAEAVAHPWLRDTGVPMVLGMGRLTGQKDFPTLIAAFARVARHRACRLLILGEGEQRPQLQRLVAELGLEDRVELHPFVPNPFPYLRAAALFVMSSRWEGFGNVLVEALYCGTPVVATDCPHGPSEILADGKYGTLVPVGDPERLADAISRTLAAPPDSRRLVERAREYSVQRIGSEYLDAMGFTAGRAVE